MTDDAEAGPSFDRIDEWERGFAERAAQAKALAERTARLSPGRNGRRPRSDLGSGPREDLSVANELAVVVRVDRAEGELQQRPRGLRRAGC